MRCHTTEIEQMCEDVETYKEAVRKQAALAEQARLKEQTAKEQERKAKSIKNKQDNSKVNLNNKSKPASIMVKFRPSTSENKEVIV